MSAKDEFRIAGSVASESEEQLLGHVVKVAGYAETIRGLVQKSFGYCDTHAIAVPRPARAPRMAPVPASCSCPKPPRIK